MGASGVQDSEDPARNANVCDQFVVPTITPFIGSASRWVVRLGPNEVAGRKAFSGTSHKFADDIDRVRSVASVFP